MLAVTIETQRIRIGQHFSVSFQRTLRIPDDSRTYPLPPGLGVFPLFRVAEYVDRVPSLWREQGGAFIPMYQREALWLGFDAAPWKPTAVKIAVGHINVISGEPHDTHLHSDPQDYVVCPPQLWVDGINTGHGVIRQFVAMPLGFGYTVEASVSGEERVGGIQIAVFEPKPGRFPDEPPPQPSGGSVAQARPHARMFAGQTMGLGAGGVMRQKIYPDPHGIDVWEPQPAGSVVVHIINSEHFREITGSAPPATPVDAGAYTKHGFPWFDLYDEEKGDVVAPDRLTTVRTLAERDAELAVDRAQDESLEVKETQIKKIRPKD